MRNVPEMMPASAERKRLFGLVSDLIDKFYSGLNERHIMPQATAHEIRDHLKGYTFESPLNPDEVLTDVSEMMAEWNLTCPHARYFGLFNPTPTFMGILGDALAGGFNPQLAAFTHGAASVEIEDHLIKYLGSLFDLPVEKVAGSFTSGGMEANETSVLLALNRKFPELREKGLRSLPGQPVLYVSEEAHHSFVKVVQNCGLGIGGIRFVPANDDLKMNVEKLAAMIDRDKQNGLLPFMVVGTAGLTGSGVVDRLEEIVDVCDQHNLHFHTDAAWGGAAVFSEKLKSVLKGIERADSITFDAHKWLSVPIGAGVFICKDYDALRHTFTFDVAASYMPKLVDDTISYYNCSMQWTRRFIGIRLFLTLAHIGKDGYCEVIEHQTDLGDRLRELLIENGWKIENDTVLPVVCFSHSDLDGERFGDELEKLYMDYVDELTNRGKAWVSVTHIRSRPVIRACITSYLAVERDLEILIDELNVVMEEFS